MSTSTDTIGVNGWPLEMHVAGDVKWVRPPIPQSRTTICPYRMLLPGRSSAGGVDRLAGRWPLAAGRCASMTHDDQVAARVRDWQMLRHGSGRGDGLGTGYPPGASQSTTSR